MGQNSSSSATLNCSPPPKDSESQTQLLQETCDDGGNDMGSPESMWSNILKDDKFKEWYWKAASYWETVEATYDGVLGGQTHVSPADIKESGEFLEKLFIDRHLGKARAIDCGAGVGRVTNELLRFKFERVDIMEQNPKYIEEAKKILKESKNVGEFYSKGMQEFVFEEKYDCVWIQWAISHLTDPDLVSFLEKAAGHLNENGMVVLKENITQKQNYVFHRDDISVTRSEATFKRLFEKAGMQVVAQEYQKDFPANLFPVCMFALRKNLKESEDK